MHVGYMGYMNYVNHMSIYINRLKSLALSDLHFVLKKFGNFLLIYEDGKPKL